MEDPEINSISEEKEKKPQYDVALVLGGNIRRTLEGKWVTTDWTEGPEKSIGAHSRIEAAAEMFKRGATDHFIVSTGKTTPDEVGSNAPTEAQVMKDELVALGVPEENVVVEDISLNTIENLIESSKIIRQKDFRKIAIMTSAWHSARSQILTGPQVQELEGEGRQVSFITPEEVLIEADPRKAEELNKIYSKDSMDERIRREQKGIEAFQRGEYNSKPGDKN